MSYIAYYSKQLRILEFIVNAAQLETARAVMGHVESRFGGVPLYARVDMLTGADGAPVLLELEAVEPNLYFETTPGVAERLADAIVAAATG